MTETLTRGEADALIADCETLAELRALSAHWIGHSNEELSADDLRGLLHEYVDERALDGDRVRSYGPSDSDATDLTAPEHACGDEPAHSDGRATYCRVCGEPIG